MNPRLLIYPSLHFGKFVSMSVNLLLFCKSFHSYHFLDSTYKWHHMTPNKTFFFFLAVPTCRSSWVRDWTLAKTVSRPIAVTTPGPLPAEPQGNSQRKPFGGLPLQHMKFPRPGIKSKPQLWQHQILNPPHHSRNSPQKIFFKLCLSMLDLGFLALNFFVGTNCGWDWSLETNFF